MRRWTRRTVGSHSATLDAAEALVDQLGAIGIPIRVGLHRGEVELRDDDVIATIMNLAARVMDAGGVWQIFTTALVRDNLAESRFVFPNAGVHDVEGFDAAWYLYSPDWRLG